MLDVWSSVYLIPAMLLSAGAPESVRESSEQEAAGSVLGSEVTITITNSNNNNTVGRPILHHHCTGIVSDLK